MQNNCIRNSMCHIPNLLPNLRFSEKIKNIYTLYNLTRLSTWEMKNRSTQLLFEWFVTDWKITVISESLNDYPFSCQWLLFLIAQSLFFFSLYTEFKSRYIDLYNFNAILVSGVANYMKAHPVAFYTYYLLKKRRKWIH